MVSCMYNGSLKVYCYTLMILFVVLTTLNLIKSSFEMFLYYEVKISISSSVAAMCTGVVYGMWKK